MKITLKIYFGNFYNTINYNRQLLTDTQKIVPLCSLHFFSHKYRIR